MAFVIKHIINATKTETVATLTATPPQARVTNNVLTVLLPQLTVLTATHKTGSKQTVTVPALITAPKILTKALTVTAIATALFATVLAGNQLIN